MLITQREPQYSHKIKIYEHCTGLDTTQLASYLLLKIVWDVVVRAVMMGVVVGVVVVAVEARVSC